MTKNEALQEVQDLSTGITHDAAQLLKLVGTGSVQLPIAGTDAYVVIGTLAGIAATAGEPFGDVAPIPQLTAPAPTDELRTMLEQARQYIEAASMTHGYGFARPANPHDFHPDHESCSAEEIAAHKAACEAYDKGEYTLERGSEWVGAMHILRAPWGIGSYNERDPAAEPILAAINAALSAPAPQQSEGLSDERVATADEATEWAQIFYRNADTFTFRDLGIAQAAWAEATRRATQAAIVPTDDLKQLRNRVSELEAARIAYASEFPLSADGEPDVGNIHANIRALKVAFEAEARLGEQYKGIAWDASKAAIAAPVQAEQGKFAERLYGPTPSIDERRDALYTMALIFAAAETDSARDATFEDMYREFLAVPRMSIFDCLTRHTGLEVASNYTFETEEFFEVEAVERVLAEMAAAPSLHLSEQDVRDQALTDAAKACEDERVEDTGTDGDTAYNNAVTHCAAAIRALKSPSTSQASDQKGGAA
jgi:hypothetical protein